MRSFGEIYEKVLEVLEQAFPKLPIVEGYPETKKIEKVPALFVEMTDLEPAGTPMTGQLDFVTYWEALIVMPPAKGRQQITARDVAARIALAVHDQTFVSYAMPARVLRCADARFDLVVAGYEVWSCEWTLNVRLGKNDWEESWEMYPETDELRPSGDARS